MVHSSGTWEFCVTAAGRVLPLRVSHCQRHSGPKQNRPGPGGVSDSGPTLPLCRISVRLQGSEVPQVVPIFVSLLPVAA